MRQLATARLLGVLVLGAAVLGACSDRDSSDPTSTPTVPAEVTATSSVPPDTAVTPTATPSGAPSAVPDNPLIGPQAPNGDTIEVPAPIVSVTVNIAESFPPQYFVQVVSALPNGCHRFSRTEVTRDGTEVRIDVFNTIPAARADLACTQIYGVMTSNVALGTDFESGTEYTLLVNDVTETFVAQ